MIRVMCGVKLMDGRNTEELMAMLGLEESLDRMAKASSMQWYGLYNLNCWSHRKGTELKQTWKNKYKRK